MPRNPRRFYRIRGRGIKEIEIVQGSDFPELKKTVNHMLRDGWSIYEIFGHTRNFHHRSLLFLLVKYEDAAEEPTGNDRPEPDAQVH